MGTVRLKVVKLLAQGHPYLSWRQHRSLGSSPGAWHSLSHYLYRSLGLPPRAAGTINYYLLICEGSSCRLVSQLLEGRDPCQMLLPVLRHSQSLALPIGQGSLAGLFDQM